MYSQARNVSTSSGTLDRARLPPRRLRVAYIADTVHSASGGGVLSAELFVDRLRVDHDVVTIAADGDRIVPALSLPFDAITKMRFTLARPVTATLVDVLRNADIVHLQFPFWLSHRALDVARRLGLPVVAAFHVQPENLLMNVGVHADWLRDALYHHMVTRLYDRVDAVVCPTRFAQQTLLDAGLVTRSLVISNGVPPDMATVRSGRRGRGLPHAARFRVLAVGRFAREKRQDVILEAVRRCRHAADIQLTLAGFGPLEDDLRERARSLPVPPRIGFLSRAELLEQYAGADLFVHAGEVELEGMSVLEAMSVGLPVLVAEAPESAASAFALSDAFRFEAGSAAQLAAKIDFLYENRDVLRVAGPLYREQAHDFDFDASVRKLEALYQELVPEAGCAAAA